MHVTWATQDAPNGLYYTYYEEWLPGTGNGWENFKNVTDYTSSETGGRPSIALSADKVSVSYNTGAQSSPDVSAGTAKERDRIFSTNSWGAPQAVYGGSGNYSMLERIYSDGTNLHMFYYALVGGQGEYYSDMYHSERPVDGTAWSTPTLLAQGADASSPASVAETNDGKLNIAYVNDVNETAYQTFDGNNWSSPQVLSSSGESVYSPSIAANGRMLSVNWLASGYLRYRCDFLDVSGTVSSNMTWDGVYNVTGNVTVNSGTNLTIDAGTYVTLANGASLTASGVLDAAGTASQPVTFTSSGSTSPGSWGPLCLADPAQATLHSIIVTCSTGRISRLTIRQTLRSRTAT